MGDHFLDHSPLFGAVRLSVGELDIEDSSSGSLRLSHAHLLSLLSSPPKFLIEHSRKGPEGHEASEIVQNHQSGIKLRIEWHMKLPRRGYGTV